MSTKGKNLRLSFDAWQEMRKLKFSEGAESYTEVLQRIFDAFEKKSVNPQTEIISKFPEDRGDENVNKSDKTIVVSTDIHNKLNEIKTKYVIEKGIASRGPNAISISDILLDLMSFYKSVR